MLDRMYYEREKRNTFEPISTPSIKLSEDLRKRFVDNVFKELSNLSSLCDNGTGIQCPVTTDKDANPIVPSAAIEGIKLEYISTTL